MDFFLFKLRSNCSECGESLILDGPVQKTHCIACDSTLEIPASNWKRLFEACAGDKLRQGKTESTVLGLAGPFPFFFVWGPVAPTCSACDKELPTGDLAPGTDGEIACSCGHATPTFAPPSWLRPHAPRVVQLVNATREGQLSKIEVTREDRPVTFGCPDCGAHLKITMESPRILGCQYCKADLFLPDQLWRALHPVRKRAAWYVALR